MFDGAWYEILSEREQKEIAFARLYAESFGHGTDGHTRLLLIARLDVLLDEKQARGDSGLVG